MAIVTCPECGKGVSTYAGLCPNCGYRFPDNQRERLPEKVYKTSEVPQKSAKENAMALLLAIAVIVLAVVLVRGYKNQLRGDDKIAYDIIVRCAERSFIYPETVQVRGGTFSVDKKSMWCLVQAQTRGGYIGSYFYWLDGEDGLIAETDEYKWCKDTTKFDVDKVNNALRKHFEKK